MIENIGRIQEEESLVSEKMWRTGSGDIISVEDMSDYHIDACIKMLEDKDDYISEIQRDMFKDEQLRRFNRFYEGIMGGNAE